MSIRTIAKKILFPGFNLGTRSRARLQRFFLTEQNAETLDIGCGNGFFTSLAAKRGGRALGVSFDEAQIARCNAFKPHLGVASDKLEFRTMNIEKLNALPERFDQILMLEVLEHVGDDPAAVANAARLLKPGGLLHISTPDVEIGEWVGTLDRHETGGHVRIGYSASRLETLVRSAGLDVSFAGRLGTWGDYLVWPQSVLSRLLGGSYAAQFFAFVVVYPLYLLSRVLPMPRPLRAFHHLVARKPMAAA